MADNLIKFPQHVAILDSDAATSKMTEQALTALGVQKCEIFTTGEEGYKAVTSKSFDGIVIDWKLKGGTSGLAVLSRLRRRPQDVYLPVLFTAGQISQGELHVLQDFPCTVSFLKPIRQPDILSSFTKLSQERQWYLNSEKLIEFAFNAAQFNPQKSLQSVQAILASSPHPTPIALIAAEHFVSLKLYKEANVIFDQVLRLEPNCLRALSAKARLLASQGKHKNAMALLQKAYAIAPKSIERLSLMGEIEISLKNPLGAIEYFQKALAIDSKDSRAQIGKTVAIGVNSMLSSQITDANCEPSIAKIINNLGVQLAQNKEHEKALKYYLMARSYLSSDELRSKVSFNLGLGFKKWNKLSQAKYWLEQALMLSEGKFSKAERHLSGLDSVVAVAGLVEEEDLSDMNLMPMMLPAGPTEKIAPEKSKSQRVDTGSKVVNIFEEESIDPGFLTPQKNPGIASAFDEMIKEIDNTLSEPDTFVTFEDAI